MLRNPVVLLALLISAMIALAQNSPARTTRKGHLLFFTLSAGFKHASIPTAVRVITQVGEKSEAFDRTASQDISVFLSRNYFHCFLPTPRRPLELYPGTAG
jgi:hypothetical protein